MRTLQSLTMKQSLFDSVARSRVVRTYEKSFPVATGFALKLQPAVQSRETGPFGAHANPFCRLMALSPRTKAICDRCYAEIRKQAAQSCSPSHSCCFARIAHVAVPVISAGEHIATIYGGQLLLEEPTRQTFEGVAGRLVDLGLEGALPTLEQAWFHTPVVSDKQLKAMIYLLENFAGRVSKYAAGRILEPIDGEPAGLTRMRKYIQARFAEPISVAVAAKHVEMSKSSFSKMFQSSLGMTFTQYLTRFRVEKTKAMLAVPSRKIREIASEAGFESVSQFNRSFRQYTEMSPTEYRASLEIVNEDFRPTESDGDFHGD